MTAPEDDRFSIEVRRVGGATVVRLSGELDVIAAPRAADLFDELAEAGKTELIIDASSLGFIDAAGIRSLIRGRDSIHRAGSTFVVIPSFAVRRLLGLLDPEPPLVLRSSIDEAMGVIQRDADG